jgi:outer membrane lipoprotein LolB
VIRDSFLRDGGWQIRASQKRSHIERARSYGIILLLAAAITGCRSLPEAVPAVDDGTPAAVAFAARRADAAEINGWTLRGRTAVAANDRGWNGALHWQQDGEMLDLRFIAPLGAGTVRIRGTAVAMRIEASDGTDFLTNDPEADLEHYLGVAVPVTAMRWWLLGVPVPGLDVVRLELDEAGRAVYIEQANWAVSYPRYAAYGDRVLPGVIEANDGETRVRLIVDHFETTGP